MILETVDRKDEERNRHVEGCTSNNESNYEKTERVAPSTVSIKYPKENSSVFIIPNLAEQNDYHKQGSSTLNNCDPVFEDKGKILKKNLICLFSFMYAMFVLVLGGVVYMYNESGTRFISHIFNSCITVLGLLWLLFLNIDLHRYKKEIVKSTKGLHLSSENVNEIIADTELAFNFNSSKVKTHSYRFLQGRHSGSFYLKCGMAAFCFGHLTHEGIQLGQEIIHLVHEESCVDLSKIILLIVRPTYSFYQLFMIFKYSNIVINRYMSQARFGLMHVMATCLCFWFHTLVEDTYKRYQLKQRFSESIINNSTMGTDLGKQTENRTDRAQNECMNSTLFSNWDIQASPYLYPFTIEFNLLLAGVWLIMWQNIGLKHSKAKPHHFSTKISTEDGIENVTYQSNLVISADFHASNKGLFAGLFLLLVTTVTMIVFFITVHQENYQSIAIYIHAGQETVLASLSLLAVIAAFHQTSKLDINLHPITFLDDILLFIPLPFYFINAILSIVAEFSHSNYLRMSTHLLIVIQVVVQTPFIVDGLRRCSNSHSLKYKKPGREIIIFLTICNLTMWIVDTFEIRSVENLYSQATFYGELKWLLIGHATLPLMLFYRFHSSVCLADIWKSGYEKGDE